MDTDKLFQAYDTAKSKARAIRGDFIDRMHSVMTVAVLLIALIVLLIKQSGDDSAIACWMPTQFSDDQVSTFNLKAN